MHTAIDIPGPETVRFHRAKSKFFTITREFQIRGRYVMLTYKISKKLIKPYVVGTH